MAGEGKGEKSPDQKLVSEGLLHAERKKSKAEMDAIKRQLADALGKVAQLSEQVSWSQALQGDDPDKTRELLFQRNKEIATKETTLATREEELTTREQALAKRDLEGEVHKIAIEFGVDATELLPLESMELVRSKALELQNISLKAKLAEGGKPGGYDLSGGGGIGAIKVRDMTDQQFEEHLKKQRQVALAKK